MNGEVNFVCPGMPTEIGAASGLLFESDASRLFPSRQTISSTVYQVPKLIAEVYAPEANWKCIGSGVAKCRPSVHPKPCQMLKHHPGIVQVSGCRLGL